MSSQSRQVHRTQILQGKLNSPMISVKWGAYHHLMQQDPGATQDTMGRNTFLMIVMTTRARQCIQIHFEIVM